MAMTLRLELFVADLAASVRFYRDVLGFTVEGEDSDYVQVRKGAVEIGLGLDDRLPPDHHFGREALSQQKGTGVEIVLEADDVDASYRHAVDAGYAINAPLRRRPWGLTDFRVIDPDGYYIRVTSRA
jgi:lactoylglutathione lyase